MMEEVQRPTSKETDEDLLRQQELFLKSNSKTALSIPPKEKQYESLEEAKARTFVPKATTKTDENFEFEMLDYSFEVREKITSILNTFTFDPPPAKAIEVLDMCDKKIELNRFPAKRKRTSLFAQLVGKSENPLIHSEKLPDATSENSLVDGSGLDAKEYERELKNINEENLAKLASMSNEEILRHQSELKKHLNPTLVRFINNRKEEPKSRSQNADFHSDRVIKVEPSDEVLNRVIKVEPTYEVLNRVIEVEPSDEVLKKEGRNDCDALILEKAMQCEMDTKNIPASVASASKNRGTAISEQIKKLVDSITKGNWQNMKKIEKEKLEWISDLPKPNPAELKTGFTARFDFEGLLLAHDVETPTFKGLHHHGEEPEVAGYSLEELFLLARSTMQSQRITALHTIAHILDNYWNGLFDGCFDNPLLPTILDAGLVPLLRWALDDTSLTSLAATITAIHSLLISKIDELCLQRTFCWLKGHIIPMLQPENLHIHNIEPEELTDSDLIKLDVIEAFLQMDILPRFSYILRVMQPPPLVCQLIIEICTRIAQHSYVAARRVATDNHFLHFIMKTFLPLNWKFIDASKKTDSVGFESPLPSAMKLMRIFQSSYLPLGDPDDLMRRIQEYLHYSLDKMEAGDSQLLLIECLKTAQVIYLRNQKPNALLPLYSLFRRQMKFCGNLDLSCGYKHLKDFKYATHLFKTLEAIAIESAHQKHPNINHNFSAIFEVALSCLKKWLWQFPRDDPSDHGIMLLSGCMNFVSTYYKKVYIHRNANSELRSDTKELFKKYFLDFVNSEAFKRLFSNIESYSLLLHSGKSGNFRDSKTIVSLGSILWNDDIVPILKQNSPIPLLLAVLQLSAMEKYVLQCTETHSAITVLQVVLCDPSLTKYLRRISSEKLNADSWFAKFEISLLSQVLVFGCTEVSKDAVLLHNVASSLLPILRSSDEKVVKFLFENIIFNPKYLLSTESRSVADETIKELISKLSIIPLCYLMYFVQDEEEMTEARKRFSHENYHLVASSSTQEFILPKDWFYTLIWAKYQKSLKSEQIKKLKTDDILELTSSLEWILLNHKLSTPLLKNIPGSVEFSYLCMIFLLHADFYQSPEIKKLLEECLSSVLKCKKVQLTKLKWSTIDGFDNLYLEMLNQFEAVSYGDELFGSFLVFPLQQCYPSRWRKLLLTDHSQVLRFLRVPLSKLFVPIKCYLTPYEMDFSIITEYYKLLVSGFLTFIRCPLIYLMAVHHIHHFIFSEQDELKIQQKKLISRILNSKEKIVQHNILLYSKVDMDCGFTLKTELTADHENHLRSIAGRSVNLDL